MNIEQERADFEAWHQHHHGIRDVYALDVYALDESGEYADKQVQGAFNVWQARAALQSQPLAVDALAQEIRRVNGNNALGAGALAEALMPFIQSALQSQKPKVSDVMLSGVLRMPFELAMADPLSRMQYYKRAQQALNELEALQESLDKAQDREDAERYRWLKVNGSMAVESFAGKYRVIDAEVSLVITDWMDSFDEAIDHARRIEEE